MTSGHELKQLIDLLQASDDPVAQLRDRVFASGGVWADDGCDGVFEVQYLGISGIGLGTTAAVRDWLRNATASIQSHTAAFSLAF